MSSELESTSCFDSEDDDATSRSDVLSCSSAFFFCSELKFGWRNAPRMGSGRDFAESNVLVVSVVNSCFAEKYLRSAVVESQVVLLCTLRLY